MWVAGARVAGAVVMALLLLEPAVVRGARAEPRHLEVTLTPHRSVAWERGRGPVLAVLPSRGDGWFSLARRYCGTTALLRRLRAANPRLREPLRGVPVQVPLEILRGDLRLAAIRGVFPADRRIMAGWQHWPLDPFGGGEESWSWLAELFTGKPGNAELLRRANRALGRGSPRRGVPMVIPEAVLLSVFRRVPPEATATPTPQPTPLPTHTPTPLAVPTRSPEPQRTAGATAAARAEKRAVSPLTYGRDLEGEYAAYRLRRGEALYSAVVVRFTGQLHAAEVNATAAIIAQRSRIKDVTAIPVGYPVRIPVDLLLPEYLPPGNPRRAAWEREQKELGRFVEVVRAANLTGVHVILDAGHGGNDSGATVDGVWESTYAYDLLCRVKRDLEQHTKATVWTTMKDESRGYQVVDRDVLEQDRDQVLLTHPPYRLEDPTTGVHLRWYLANDIIRGLLSSGVPRSKIVFLSFHADSLHPSVRGTMAYVPSRYLRPKSFGVGRKVMREYREYRRDPRVRLSARLKARTEASSRRLAERLIEALRREGLEVHPYEPIRDSVLRGRRRWVPAVLRYSLAQNAVLIECCNLANERDRHLLLKRSWRERFARAVVGGVARTFANGS